MEGLTGLDEGSKLLIHKAEETLVHAYAPYSDFFVGAALMLESGDIITGANQENSAYPLCMCAERVALYAKASRFPDVRVQKIAVVARNGNRPALVAATPCGACRQVMLEFELRQQLPIEVIMMVAKDQWIKLPDVKSLLPYSFTPANLRV
jgi:cytidine deaminase